MIDELEDDLNQALNDSKLQRRVNLVQIELHKASQKVRKASQLDKLILPDALLVICLDDQVEFCIHLLIVDFIIALG